MPYVQSTNREIHEIKFSYKYKHKIEETSKTEGDLGIQTRN
jgi:hypothetical protein